MINMVEDGVFFEGSVWLVWVLICLIEKGGKKFDDGIVIDILIF